MTPGDTETGLAPKRILVVEDGPEVAKALRLVLSIGGGHKVETVGDGEKALARFEPGKYDVVITDLVLPKMRGTDLARAIKQKHPGQPIILITGHADEVSEDTAELVGIDVLVAKPFSLDQLQQALVMALVPPPPAE